MRRDDASSQQIYLTIVKLLLETHLGMGLAQDIGYLGAVGPHFISSTFMADAVVDRVARALTMLYVADLRDLQNDINDILVSAQEFTANP